MEKRRKQKIEYIYNPSVMIKELRILIWTLIWIVFLLVIGEALIANGWPWKISMAKPYLLRKNNDDWTHNAFEIQRIKKMSDPQKSELLVFIGGSVSLEAIYKDNMVSRSLTAQTGRPTNFVSLCSSYQTFADNAKIVHELGKFGGTILIGIEPLSFKAPLEYQLTQVLEDGRIHHKYYFLRSPAGITRILNRHGFGAGIFEQIRLFRTMQFLGESLQRKSTVFFKANTDIPSVVYNRHAVGDKTPVSGNQSKRQRKWLKKLRKRYSKYWRLNLDLLKEIIRIAQSNGNDVIIIDLPDNPIFSEEIASFNPHYDNMISRLRQATGIGYIDMRNAVRWAPEDFRDVHHMRSFGQKKFFPVLSEKLTEYLNNRREHKPSV
jgi:hypothetical protein